MNDYPPILRNRAIALAVALAIVSPGPLRGEDRPHKQPAPMPWVQVSADQRGFVLSPGGQKFTPRGFNYDRNHQSQLLEDYWQTQWKKIEEDLAEMRQLGANVVRVHLQLGKFMDTPRQPNQQSLDRLGKLLQLAERLRLYLDITGLGCYHRQDVPDWYDELTEADRWSVQAAFWKAVAQRCAKSPAVFCYDLMNEPIAPATADHKDWLGPGFAGKHFVQMIGLDNKNRPRPQIARQWIRQLTAAIRSVDKKHLITVGLVPWSLDRPGLTSGFVPGEIVDDLDFVSVHLYPESNKVDEALQTLKGFSVGKPVVVEETFPLKCSREEFERFVDGSQKTAAGWIMFYWGKTPDELRRSETIGDVMLLESLEFFERKFRDRAE